MLFSCPCKNAIYFRTPFVKVQGAVLEPSALSLYSFCLSSIVLLLSDLHPLPKAMQTWALLSAIALTAPFHKQKNRMERQILVQLNCFWDCSLSSEASWRWAPSCPYCIPLPAEGHQPHTSLPIGNGLWPIPTPKHGHCLKDDCLPSSKAMTATVLTINQICLIHYYIMIKF